MPEPALVPTDRRCVWMDAGFISFRLCDRAWDCEHCLLNAALCGQPSEADASGDDPVPDSTVPEDRLYCPGHTWIRALPGDPTSWRFGIDPFAAAILGKAVSITWPPPHRRLDSGNAVCHIRFDAGEVVLSAPVPCRLIRANDALRADPGRMVTDPCGSGWIADLRITDLGPLPAFLSPADASRTIRLDLTRFRHALALELLSHACSASAAALRPGRTLAYMPRLLGPGSYVRLLGEFVH